MNIKCDICILQTNKDAIKFIILSNCHQYTWNWIKIIIATSLANIINISIFFKHH